MQGNYHFGLGGQRVGPLEPEAIKARILKGEITYASLAWREGMPDWQPVSEIPDLMAAFGEMLSAQAKPPPLPGDASERAAATPPPLPAAGAEQAAGPELSALGRPAYGFVLWIYRSWGGRKPWIRRYVEQEPRRAPLVAAATLAILALVAVLAATEFLSTARQAPTDDVMIDRWPGREQTDTGLFPPEPGTPESMDEIYRKALRD